MTAETLLLVVPPLTLMAVSEVAIEAVMVEALRPKETLFEFEKVKAEARLLVVPAERLIEPCVLATVTLAVTTDELLIPKVTLLLFDSTTVPPDAVCVPAAIAPRSAAEAVMFEPSKPKRTLLESAKVSAETFAEVVPPDTLMLPWELARLAEAVTVEPSSPKVTLFEFEKTTVPEETRVVPAEIAAGPVDWSKLAEAVTVPASSPKETLFLFEKVNADDRLLVVPAERMMLAAPAAPAEAVSVWPSSPNVTLFEFEKTTVPRLAVTAPATSAAGTLRVIAAMPRDHPIPKPAVLGALLARLVNERVLPALRLCRRSARVKLGVAGCHVPHVADLTGVLAAVDGHVADHHAAEATRPAVPPIHCLAPPVGLGRRSPLSARRAPR